MKLITRDTDYAIRALCYVARHRKKMVSARELVKKLGIPCPFLRKILQILNKKKLLTSYKGKGGGFTLGRDPRGILLADLMKIFQGPIVLSEHIFKKSICPHVRTCALRKRLDVIEKHVIKELKSISIALLIKNVAGER